MFRNLVVGIFVGLLGTAAESEAFIEQFESLNEDNWHPAHYQFSHPAFDTDWDRGKVEADNGLTLSLAPQSGANRFSGASVRRQEPTHFGLYQAELQVARGPGLITGFFLYTGPAYGTQHDEIDWEFFGQDPTTAQAAWFNDGELRQRKIHLGFDASGCVHRYGIDWQPDRIRWFVNDRLVFETSEAVPQTPQRLFANLWAADRSVSDWAGLADPDTHAKARALMLEFAPMEEISTFRE